MHFQYATIPQSLSRNDILHIDSTNGSKVIRGTIAACINRMLINEGETTNLNLEIFNQDTSAATTNSSDRIYLWL